MKLLAFLLIWISLGVGAVATTTAYVWRVPETGDLESFRLAADEDGQAVYAILAADAGKIDKDTPIIKADTPLTPEVVKQLQEAKEPVDRVRVKSFKLSRWTHLPYFGAACVGLLAGAFLTRRSTARAIKLADELAEHEDTMTPEKALTELRLVVGSLLEDISTLGEPHHACHTITHKLGDAISDYVPAITDQRERLVARMGLGTYAGLMDVFSAAERSMNRAWSAAADFSLDESMESLERAAERLAVAEDKLTGRTPSLLPLG